MNIHTDTAEITYQGVVIDQAGRDSIYDSYCTYNRELSFIYNRKRFSVVYLSSLLNEKGETLVVPRCLYVKPKTSRVAYIIMTNVYDIWVYSLQYLKPSGEKRCLSYVFKSTPNKQVGTVFNLLADVDGSLTPWLLKKSYGDFKAVKYHHGGFLISANNVLVDIPSKLSEILRGLE